MVELDRTHPIFLKFKAEREAKASAADMPTQLRAIVDRQKQVEDALTQIAAGLADLKAVLLAPVELEVGADGVKRARRVMERK